MNSNYSDTMRCINNLNVSPSTPGSPARLSPRVTLGVKLNILKSQDEPSRLSLLSPRSSESPRSLDSPCSSSIESGSISDKCLTSTVTARNLYYRYKVCLTVCFYELDWHPAIKLRTLLKMRSTPAETVNDIHLDP